MAAFQHIAAEDGQQRYECSHENQHCRALTKKRRETVVKLVYGRRAENFGGKGAGAPGVYQRSAARRGAACRAIGKPPVQATSTTSSAARAFASAAFLVLPAREGGWHNPQTKPC